MSGTNSGERILAVLGLFSEARPEWTPEEMMVATGYSRPTLYRYLKSLRDAGLLTSLPGAGFTLGPRVVELDYLMRKADPLILAGQGVLDELVARYPCSSLLVRWYGTSLLCVASECSMDNPLSSYPRGRPMPLARGAISRAIMAWLPRRRLLPLVEANLAELTELGMGESVDDVIDALRAIRRVGVALAHGEVTPGVIGVAAPIFDAGQSPIAALAVTSAGQDMSEEKLMRISGDVTGFAADVSAKLGQWRFDEGLPRRAANV
jgi:DNA-binding IclR family transcriptional regulator